ncbi:hypothetical protein V1508DRAFT_427877 [Lipomyces doorenjongii]|uniref:uncharacterized protein n=1 Tax=Lipomyces doorenjongii TaxID=383834 RepID=UPI0034CDCF9A
MPRKRACDGCNVRKVKCDGTHPCQPCQKASIECSYLKIWRRSGPQKLRSATLQTIKLSQKQDAELLLFIPATSPLLSERLPVSSEAPSSNSQPVHTMPTNSMVPTFEPRIPLKALRPYVHIYRKRLYVVWPIIDLTEMYTLMDCNCQDWQFYSLICAVCAVTMAQFKLPASSDGFSHETLVHESTRAKAIVGYTEETNINDILVPFFLHSYYMNVKRDKTSSRYLREAIAAVHVLRLHLEETYKEMPYEEEQRMRMLYSFMLVTERGHAMQHELPVILEDTIKPPTVNMNESDADFLLGFINLVKIFRSPDRMMFDKWKRPESVIYSRAFLRQQQRRLDEIMKINSLTLTNDIQKVDILVTQRWMQALTWHLSVIYGPLDEASSTNNMSLTCPADIVRTLLASTADIAPECFEAHGPGMKTKLLDISGALADIILLLPNQQHGHLVTYWQSLLHQFSTFVYSLNSPDPITIDKITRKLSNALNVLSIIPRAIEEDKPEDICEREVKRIVKL